ncbi:MAG TPA: DUF4239 domain-containing protein [Kofleriaceae bacterium]|jgi:hypothetical protein|nr:DUF4239 domain-containing protein [Kofleriaceae bacterium]
MPYWLKTTLGLMPIVIGVSIVAVILLVVVRQAVPPEALQASSDAVGNYLQTVGGIYAVLLAFIVYVVWGQFNDARTYVEREATALVDLHRTASGLPKLTRVEIQQALRLYVDQVIDLEWRAMAHHDEDTLEQVGAHLDRVWVAIHGCRPLNECQHAIYSEVLSRYNDLSDMRTSRLSTSRARIPFMMKALLYLGAAIVIGSIYLMYVDKFWIHAAITAALAGAVAHILFLINDLDNAFAGHLQVSKAAFERSRRAFDRAIHLVDAAA